MSGPKGKNAATGGSSSPTQQGEALGGEALNALDRTVEAFAGQITGGLSPAALTLAMMDWGMHLAARSEERR